MAKFNVSTFGALGDGKTPDDKAFSQALTTLDSLVNNNESSGGVLVIPKGTYLLNAPLRLKRPVTLRGEGSQASYLLFDRPHDPKGPADQTNLTIDGIVIDESAGHSSIRDLSLKTGRNFAPTSPNVPPVVGDDDPFIDDMSKTNVPLASGIVLKGSFVSIENCTISGFQHDGIYIFQNVNASKSGGPYVWSVRHCLIEGNGRHGVFTTGGVNSGCAWCVECSVNGRYGFYDASGGNTYLACSSESNGSVVGQVGGQYLMGASKNGASTAPNLNVLLGCRDDGGAASRVVGPTVVIGGSFNVDFSLAGSSSPPILYDGGDFSAPGIRDSGISYVNASQTLTANMTTLLADSSAGQKPLHLRLPSVSKPNVLPPSTYSPLLGCRVTVKKTNAGGPDVIIEGGKIEEVKQIALSKQYAWVTVVAGPDIAPGWYVVGGDGFSKVPL